MGYRFIATSQDHKVTGQNLPRWVKLQMSQHWSKRKTLWKTEAGHFPVLSIPVLGRLIGLIQNQNSTKTVLWVSKYVVSWYIIYICSVRFWYIHLPYIYIVTHVFVFVVFVVAVVAVVAVVVVIHIGMSVVMIMILVAWCIHRQTYACIYIYSNDLTGTSLEWWLLRGNYPKLALLYLIIYSYSRPVQFL